MTITIVKLIMLHWDDDDPDMHNEVVKVTEDTQNPDEFDLEDMWYM